MIPGAGTAVPRRPGNPPREAPRRRADPRRSPAFASRDPPARRGRIVPPWARCRSGSRARSPLVPVPAGKDAIDRTADRAVRLDAAEPHVADTFRRGVGRRLTDDLRDVEV